MNIAKNPINYCWPDEVIVRDLLLCSKFSCGGATGTQDSKRTLNTQASQASQICEPYLESKFMEFIYLDLFSRTLTENIIKCFIGVVYNRIMHETLLMHMDTSCCET